MSLECNKTVTFVGSMRIGPSHSPVVGIFCTQVLASPVWSDDHCKHLTATGGPNYAPANWLEDGKLIGYMPEIVSQVARELNLEIKISPSGHWKRALANTANGNFDIIMGLSKNAERMKVFDYTVPVAQDPVSVIVWHDSDLQYNGTWESLKKYQGGVRLGARFNPSLNTHIYDDLSVHRVPNHASIYRQLERGRIDYFIGGHFSAMVNASDLGILKNIKLLEPALGSDDVYMAFSKKSPCRYLIGAFTNILSQMKSADKINGIVEHYKMKRLGDKTN